MKPHPLSGLAGDGTVLDTAIAEAERFLNAAYRAKNATDDDYCASPNRSAARRASMDLTRALSALRQTNATDWRRA